MELCLWSDGGQSYNGNIYGTHTSLLLGYNGVDDDARGNEDVNLPQTLNTSKVNEPCCDVASTTLRLSSNTCAVLDVMNDGRSGSPMDEQTPNVTLYPKSPESPFHPFLQSPKNWTTLVQNSTTFGLEKLAYQDAGQNGKCNGSFVSFLQEEKPLHGATESVHNSYNYSEIEKLVMDILSVEDFCSFLEIIKRLPAVTSPKCVTLALENLTRNGFVEVVSKHPPIYTTKRQLKLDENRSLDDGRRTILPGLIHKYPLDSIPSEHTQDWSVCNNEAPVTSGRISTNRSSSSPNLGNLNPRYSVQRHRKISDSVINGFHSEKSSMHLGRNGKVVMEETLRELSSNSFELNPLQKSIIQVLTENNRPLTTLEIAKEIGLTTKRDVNSSLYAMERSAVIQRVKYQPPVWSLNCRRDPGVIGEERNMREPSRRKSLNESILSGRNRSLGDFERQAELLKPRSRSFNSEGDTGGIKSCGLCKISFTSKQQSDEHFQSSKHQNKIAKITSEPYLKFCEYCKVHLNSKSQANEHFTSGRHEQTVAKSQKAPTRDHPPLVLPCEGFNPVISTETSPYGYQVELYYKAMTANSVCFLPTGTGKTLVAALAIAHLLKLNPSRQIIFLVDRVLLVIQQSDYLKSELKNVKIPVSAKDEGQSSNQPGVYGQNSHRNAMPALRALRIGAICGEMRKLEQGVSIFNHDVLVVTADCYRNHINNGTLRFEDAALIVLDESHHCNKDHPYNVIIRNYYLPDEIPFSHRPKILGLTASPAGEPTLERTVKKMQRLLGNLGGAALHTVTENIPELTEKTNQTEMVCYCAEYTQAEQNLLSAMMEYATKCFNLAARLSEFKEYKDVFQPSAGAVLSKDDIYPILGVIDNILASCKPDVNAVCSLMHFQIISDCICTLQECGEKVAFDRMAELAHADCPHGFDWARDQGLPCDKIRCYMEQRVVEGYRALRYVDDLASGVAGLLELLLKVDWNEREESARPLALVLVKRRCTAVCLAEYLTSCSELKKRRVRTTYIIGHGAKGVDRGMTVTKQIETLKDIRQGDYQVVIATSVAEEGLDLPACELVVQMDPPSSVTALVQIRGRARQKHAQFAAICRDKDQAKKIKDLLQREDNMRRAAQIINGHKLSGIY